MGILPIGALWYLLPIFVKKDTLGKLLNRINQSSISKSLARLGNNRIVRLSNLALCGIMTADAIYSFPKHPRFSLAIVVIYVALSFGSLIIWASQALEVRLLKQIQGVLEFVGQVWEFVKYTQSLAEASRAYIEGTEKSHSEAHEATTVALRAVNDAVQEVARVVTTPTQVKSDKKEPPQPQPLLTK